MTIVAGHISHSDGAILATDSQFTIGDHVELGAVKVCSRRGIHIAIAGAGRVLDVVEFALDEVSSIAMVDSHVLARELDVAFARVGWEAEKSEGRASYRDFGALVTDGRRLFEVDPHLYFREI